MKKYVSGGMDEWMDVKADKSIAYSRGGQTPARGQKSACHDIFKCPLTFFENQIC